MPRDKPGAWQGAGSSPPKEDDEPVHPLGPETPNRFLPPDFASTGATGMDASVEDPDSFQLRRDSPYVTELIPPQQAFHSTPIEPDDDVDHKGDEQYHRLPLTTEQTQTLTKKEGEPTDIFIQEKFTVPVDIQPSERWTAELFNLPGSDPASAVKIAERQEKRARITIINTSAVTISLGPTIANVIPVLTANGTTGDRISLDTLAPVYANSVSAATILVIQEFSE